MKTRATLLTRADLEMEDVSNLLEWSQQHPDNDFDARVLLYPRTIFARTADCFVPVHPVLMYESLAPRPGIGKLAVARSLKAMTDLVEAAAKDCGYAETYCITSSLEEVKLAERRGWEVALHDPGRGRWLIKRKLSHIESIE